MHTDTHDVADWYRRYAPAIHGYALSRTRDADLADDCTGVTFLRAFAKRASFTDRGGGVRPWLFTIARNVVHDHLKARRREMPLAEVDSGLDCGPSPEQAALVRELRDALDRRIGQLPPEQARCVRLRFLEELSVAETARAMDRAEPPCGRCSTARSAACGRRSPRSRPIGQRSVPSSPDPRPFPPPPNRRSIARTAQHEQGGAQGCPHISRRVCTSRSSR